VPDVRLQKPYAAVTNPDHRPAVGHRRLAVLAVEGPAEAHTITGSGRRG